MDILSGLMTVGLSVALLFGVASDETGEDRIELDETSLMSESGEEGQNDGDELVRLCAEEVPTLQRGQKVEVTGQVVYLSPDNFKDGGRTYVSFTLELATEDGVEYDVMGDSFPGDYKEIIASYPDMRVPPRQIGPDKRYYDMTIRGIVDHVRISGETGEVTGVDLESVEMVSLGPA